MSKMKIRDRSPSRSAKSPAIWSARKRDKRSMSGDDYDDDRYEIYSLGEEFGQSTSAKKGHPEPVLDDFIEIVLSKKHEVVAERLNTRSKLYANALQFTKLLITCAYDRHIHLKTYIRATKGRPDVSHFRAADQNTFCCLVPLKRPVRLGTFKIIYKNPRDFPSHRILVSLDDPVSNLEGQQMATEWGHCVDIGGVVRPDLILTWFNEGLAMTCDLLTKNTVESHFNFKDLTYSVNEDGTMNVKISSTNEDSDETEMKINIAPCIVLDEIPRQINMPALFPSRRPHFELNSKFKNLVVHELEHGKELLFLKASLENTQCLNGYEPNITSSWALYTELLEDLGLKFVREQNGDLYEEDLRFVLNQVMNYSTCLNSIPVRMINNCIFQLNKKMMGKMKLRDRWFMELLKLLLSKIRCKKFPAFFLPKLDLLCDLDTELMADELEKVINDLESDPSLLLKYTGNDTEPQRDEDEENHDEKDDVVESE